MSKYILVIRLLGPAKKIHNLHRAVLITMYNRDPLIGVAAGVNQVVGSDNLWTHTIHKYDETRY